MDSKNSRSVFTYFLFLALLLVNPFHFGSPFDRIFSIETADAEALTFHTVSGDASFFPKADAKPKRVFSRKSLVKLDSFRLDLIVLRHPDELILGYSPQCDYLLRI